MTVALGDAGTLLGRLHPRVLLSDVDGTLVGRGGSLLTDLEGQPTLAAAEALVAAARVGLRVVLVSGRTRMQLHEGGRLLGLGDCVAELGTVVVAAGRIEYQWGAAPRDLGITPAAAITRSGADELLLRAYAGRLEPHTPWDQGREGSVLLRGAINADEATARLQDAGLGWVRVADNGHLREPVPALGLTPGEGHTYHLVPNGVGKGTGAARYLELSGLTRDQAAAIGDSTADLELSETAGVMFLVGNAGPATRAAAPSDTVVTDGHAGIGWAEAVHALLARITPPGS